MTERRIVRIDRSPPRRLLAPLRWRSLKTSPDRIIWDACWQPAARLLDAGWRLVAVTVDWGPALPMTAAWREETLRELTGCGGDCAVRETVGDTGRGSMTVEMTRD